MGILPELIRIGPAALSAKWVALMICFLLGTTLLRKGLERRSFDGQKQVGWLVEAALLGFLMYRLLTVGFDWQAVWNNPRYLLFAIGPSYAMWGAIAGSVVYFLWRAYKAGVLSWGWIEAWIVPISMVVVLYSLLMAQLGRVTILPWGVLYDGALYHPLNLYRALAWGGSAWWISRLQTGSIAKIGTALVAWSISEVVVSWFSF